VLIINDAADQKIVRSFRNIPKTVVVEARNANVLEVAQHQFVLITEAAVGTLATLFATKKKAAVTATKE
jgi:ribosomal protein L4